VSCLKKRTSFRNPRGPFGAAHKIALNRIEQNENSIPESANYFPSATVLRKGNNALFPTATFIPSSTRFTLYRRTRVGRPLHDSNHRYTNLGAKTFADVILPADASPIRVGNNISAFNCIGE
jgi:hypothetical protein